MLRSKSPFVVATAGGILSLVGDKIWLTFDWLVKPWFPAEFQGLVYVLIGLTFATGLGLMAWSIVLFKRNGHALHEVKAEIGYRRQLLQRRRFHRVFASKPLG